MLKVKIRNDYYVYAWLRAVSDEHGPVGSPYYIGKGVGKRAYVRHHVHKAPTDLSNIVILKGNLSESAAFEVEIAFIALFGRIDLKTGCLKNYTHGGRNVGGGLSPEVSKIVSRAVQDSLARRRAPVIHRKLGIKEALLEHDHKLRQRGLI